MEENPGAVEILDQSHHSDNITGIIPPLADLPRLPQSIVNSVGSGRSRRSHKQWWQLEFWLFYDACELHFNSHS